VGGYISGYIRYCSSGCFQLFPAVRLIRPAHEIPAMFRYARRCRRGPDLSRRSLPPMLSIVRESRAGYAGAEPVDEADALDDLGDEIATLAAHIHAATQRFLALIAEFDRRRGWELDGHRSCAHWLSYRTGIDLGACREKVRTARVLEELPRTSAAMARGELSFSAVRALSRVATAENEADLLALATGCTIAQLERTVRGWKRLSRIEEGEVERERHDSRAFSVFPDDDGMYVVKGRLPAEVGALLMFAVDAASDALYREHPTGAEGSDAERRKRATQRRADAVALVAECALAAGFGGGACKERVSATAPEGPARDDVGTDEPTGSNSAPISGSRAERYQVVLHVDSDTLTAAAESGRSHREDGTRVSAETSRRVSCDSGRGRYLRLCAAPSTFATVAAGSRAAACGSPTPITSSTGPMVEKHRSETACCSAATTTGSCTRVDGG